MFRTFCGACIADIRTWRIAYTASHRTFLPSARETVSNSSTAVLISNSENRLTSKQLIKFQSRLVESMSACARRAFRSFFSILRIANGFQESRRSFRFRVISTLVSQGSLGRGVGRGSLRSLESKERIFWSTHTPPVLFKSESMSECEDFSSARW